MSPRGKIIFVAMLILLVGGVILLKQNREPGSLADGEQPVVQGLPVFVDIITPT